MKKIITAAICGLLMCIVLDARTPKYIFFFIGDGMGSNQVYMTSAYNIATGGKALNFESFPYMRLVSTFSASSLVTDSSAAGTALSTGTKTNNGSLGIDPQGNALESIAETAKHAGYATGVVSTVSVNHATPASFYAHVAKRNDYNTIARQLIGSEIDFAAGESFLTKDGMTADSLISEARQAGISVYEGKGAYRHADGRVIYLESPDHGRSVNFAIDREDGGMTLADFTAAAIEHLSSASRKGFFLMVEGGKIDHACHSRDAAGTICEINDMALSVQLALDFASEHPEETLIIITSDHDTGGCCVGAGEYKCHPEFLQYQKCSKNALTEKLYKLAGGEGYVSWPSVKDVLSKELGLWDKVEVSKDEEKRLTQLYKETFLDGAREEEKNLYSSNSRLATEAVEYLNKTVSGISWPFNSHSGAPVRLYIWGAKAKEFNSCYDNTDIPKTIARVAGFR